KTPASAHKIKAVEFVQAGPLTGTSIKKPYRIFCRNLSQSCGCAARKTPGGRLFRRALVGQPARPIRTWA
ncbi:hypothetical protein, partial [Paracoccus yeei]|uniref:hypothetical protein n=1 Tax=Paracoccus yeei TaxID=147645 RepID=UPI0028D2FB27